MMREITGLIEPKRSFLITGDSPLKHRILENELEAFQSAGIKPIILVKTADPNYLSRFNGFQLVTGRDFCPLFSLADGGVECITEILESEGSCAGSDVNNVYNYLLLVKELDQLSGGKGELSLNSLMAFNSPLEVQDWLTCLLEQNKISKVTYQRILSHYSETMESGSKIFDLLRSLKSLGKSKKDWGILQSLMGLVIRFSSGINRRDEVRTLIFLKRFLNESNMPVRIISIEDDSPFASEWIDLLVSAGSYRLGNFYSNNLFNRNGDERSRILSLYKNKVFFRHFGESANELEEYFGKSFFPQTTRAEIVNRRINSERFLDRLLRRDRTVSTNHGLVEQPIYTAQEIKSLSDNAFILEADPYFGLYSI